MSSPTGGNPSRRVADDHSPCTAQSLVVPFPALTGYARIPDLFDTLRQIVTANRRDVQALEAANIVPNAIFHGDPIPTDATIGQRRQVRQKWFESGLDTLDACDFVFVDPDNGLEPTGFSPGSSKAGKSVTLAELRALARLGRCLIVYHHHTRRKGGHHAEIGHWETGLREIGFTSVDALRARSYSPRVFFVLKRFSFRQQFARATELCWQIGILRQAITDSEYPFAVAHMEFRYENECGYGGSIYVYKPSMRMFCHKVSATSTAEFAVALVGFGVGGKKFSAINDHHSVRPPKGQGIHR
jgi:hypothetical protein